MIKRIIKYSVLGYIWTLLPTVLKVITAPFILGYIYHKLTKKYINPYKLVIYIGKRGAGKSTTLTKIARKYMKRGIPVYSTMAINGTYQLDYKDIGKYELPEDSILLIDEVGMIWDNRKFKTFSDEVRDWFKLQRHRRITVYMFSQAYDVDLKLRKLVDKLYIIENRFRVFCYAKRISTKIVLNKSTAEASSKIDEDMNIDTFLFFWAGTRQLTFIPKYIKYFNSYEAPKLEEKTYIMWGAIPPDIQKKLDKQERKRHPRKCKPRRRILRTLGKTVIRETRRKRKK
ncbi:MAG: ATP-binding protein [Oscillospiraceae bacterium]|nr:ATP-binding protein [Oscillospiraceae bacterium]